jgi:hypothetical protein
MRGESKFTPGPWRLARDGTTVLCGVPRQCRTLFVADCASSHHAESEQDRANATLIAAAPTLWQMLRDVDDWFASSGQAEDHPLRMSLRSAIAQALESRT